MAVLILLAVYALFFTAQIALGQVPSEGPLLPDCYNVQEVLMSWGSFGKFATVAVGTLIALRPTAMVLLNIASRLGPQAQAAAQVFYTLGQAAAFLCPGKPAFAQKFTPPTPGAPVVPVDAPPVTADISEPKEPPKAV